MAKPLYRKLIVLRSWPNLLQTSFFKKPQLSAYLSASHIAIGNNLNNLLENSDGQIALQNSESIPIWQQSCERLESLLEANKNKSNIPINILIGSDLVRFLMLPPQQMMMNSHEKIAYATAAFQEIYGANASNWQIKFDDNAPNQPRIVAAIDKNLITRVNQITSKNHIKINSLQPYVMTAFNESAKHFHQSNTYLAIVEVNRLTLIFLEAGRYQQLRSHVISDDWQADLKKILLRESALSETACRDILVYSTVLKSYSLKSHIRKAQSFTIEGWTIKSIDQFKTRPIAGNYRFLKAAI